jgi:hypothetical protein
MLLVDFQAQVSGDGGLNDIPIEAVTTTNCQLPVAGGDIQSSVSYYPIFFYILTNLTINNCYFSSAG